MEVKIVKVTDKGQISIPVEVRESIGICEGDELVVLREGNFITMKKVKRDDFKDLLKHSEKVAEKLWSNKEDDVWDGFWLV
jgi:antitoxin PrlF